LSVGRIFATAAAIPVCIMEMVIIVNSRGESPASRMAPTIMGSDSIRFIMSSRLALGSLAFSFFASIAAR
jgi:hypothetical protein